MHNENEAIVLVDEEGQEHAFHLVDVVMVGEQRYALLEPVEPEDDEEGAYLFRIDTEDGEDRLVVVEDDDEFDRVVQVLEQFEDEDVEYLFDEDDDDHDHDHDHDCDCGHDHHH